VEARDEAAASFLTTRIHLSPASAKPLRPCLVPKNFQNFLSHRMFGHIHKALNIDEKKLITQFGRNPRDESFESN
jgi:hypothetical protein